MTLEQFDPERTGVARLAQAKSVEALRSTPLAELSKFADGRVKRIALLGTGGEGLRFAEICRSLGIELVGVFDGNARKRGAKFAGMPIYPSDALTGLPRDVPIVIASHRVLGSYEALRAEGYAAIPLAQLQVAIPGRFPPHAFYDRLLEDLFENRERYVAMFGCLSDDLSKRTLNSLIAFRLSLDPSHLRDVVDWDLYGASGLFQFGTDEVYVDGGSYDGDSIDMFREHVGGKFDQVFGFEPDRETFKRLKSRMGGDSRIELHNAGLYSTTGVLGFVADGSRAAKIDPDASFRINTVNLDALIPNKKVTFIKMNIEGAEIEALKGGSNIIGKWAPKLAISAYHRPSDLWQLMDLIETLNRRYRFYLRQHDGGIIETVLYAIPT